MTIIITITMTTDSTATTVLIIHPRFTTTLLHLTVFQGLSNVARQSPRSLATSPPDRFFYSLNITDSTVLTVSTCNSATEFDSVLYLYDMATDKVLAFDDDDESCADGSQLSSLALSVTPGIYIVRIDEYGDEGENSYSDEDYYYYLNYGDFSYSYDDSSYSFSDDSAEWVFEDDYWASLLSSGGAFQVDISCTHVQPPVVVNPSSGDVLTGNIGAYSFATYVFSVQENTHLHASTCDPGSNFDTKIFLYKEDCTTLVQQNDDDRTCSSDNTLSSISVKVDIATGFCLKVGGFGTASGTFKLQIDVANATTQPTFAPTGQAGCQKTCRGKSCSEIDSTYGTADGYCDYQGNDLVGLFGCSCASCECNMQGVAQVGLNLIMTAAVVPNSALNTFLQTTIANALGVATLAFTSFSIEYLNITAETGGSRRLSTTFQWSVDLQLSVSLAATSSSDANTLANSYQSTLVHTDYTTVDSTLSISSTSSTSTSVSTVTPSPTSSPIAASNPQPNTTPEPVDKKSSNDSNVAATIAGASIGSFLALLAICLACVCRQKLLAFFRHRAEAQNGDNIVVFEQWRAEYGKEAAESAHDKQSEQAADFQRYIKEIQPSEIELAEVQV